ncbi:MAG TPA: SpoIIE family protein phosphatase [Gemmatimonadales bacterium]|nr:SpoIIE family protein phosphatase [Gemmatimonadales bacterium]
MTRLDSLVAALTALTGTGLRVWRRSNGDAEVRLLAGRAPARGWRPPLPAKGAARTVKTPDGPARFAPVPGVAGAWLEARAPKPRGGPAVDAKALARVVAGVIEAEDETRQVAAELSERYEEIDLIYSISEVLGHTIQLSDAAARILKEVSGVVGARRATLLAVDEGGKVLRIVAAQGMDPSEAEPIEVDDPSSVAARVFREGRIHSYNPPAAPEHPEDPGRAYRGHAYLSVPVLYGTQNGVSRPIGVINFTDRAGGDAFSSGDRKLVAAIANQIGAALANARLVSRDLEQQRLRRELELARDLQLKLLPSPLVIAARADVAARCRPAEVVGGDFYNLLRLPGDRVGVMIGDVSSHGFGAALIMALAMAASGIHAESAVDPAEVLGRLEESLSDELAKTEMFLTLFYGVIDPGAGRLTYANAGHPHAFVVREDGRPQRLEATRPPLGLAAGTGAPEATQPWARRADTLCLFTDGIADATSLRGTRFGEERVLGHVGRMRGRPTIDILNAVTTELDAFTDGADPADDRTIVLLRV